MNVCSECPAFYLVLLNNDLPVLAAVCPVVCENTKSLAFFYAQVLKSVLGILDDILVLGYHQEGGDGWVDKTDKTIFQRFGGSEFSGLA